MILKALTLENFKGIREPVRIEFAPLTLLFGPNNAGKSTIVQALMYAREVLEHQNCDAGRTQLGGDVIDLGGFENLVYGHDRNRVIRMRFELDLSGKGNGLPEYSDWVRQGKLENNVDWFFNTAPKHLEINSIETVVARLTDVWVEIQISWSDSQQRPVVRTYSVGTKHEIYATISYDDVLDRAALSYFNFGVYPFGTRYRQGEASDLDWALAHYARKTFRECVEQGVVENLAKGSRIGMRDEDGGTASNYLSRERFDALVSDVVQGTGLFAPCSTDAQDETNQEPERIRQQLMEDAQGLVRVWSPIQLKPAHLDPRKYLDRVSSPSESRSETTDAWDAEGSAFESMEKLVASSMNQSGATTGSSANGEDGIASQDFDEDGAPDDRWEDRMSRLTSPIWLKDEELESWLLELFVALLRDGYVPTSADDKLPLKLRSSALPEWKRTLDFDPHVWLSDKWNEFWEFPAFSQEYLKDILTTVITGPGERLLGVLQQAIYVSPFREMPPRHYQPARSPAPQRWANGLAAWDWIMLKGKPFADAVNGWLTPERRFNAGYEIDLRHYHELELDDPLLTSADKDASNLSVEWLRDQLSKLPQGRRLQIKDLRNGITLFPQDLGVGISQVIPVIVAALHNAEGVVAIEEPESNIHPAFQVVLADLFITQAKANPDVMFLVETHSEHLMLRCLRRIRENAEGRVAEGEPSLIPEDIAVHFIEPSEAGSRIHRIRIDEDGEFMDPWPKGFFPERMKEVYGDDL